MSDAERESEHQVTPLELFFDLVFVFTITQVTSPLADDPTWAGVLRGMLVLAALWWAWSVYAWLTSTIDVDEGGVRLAMLGSMGAMFGVALAVPGSFGDDPVLFGVAYLLVRILHLVLSAIVAREDRDRRGALLRFAPTAIFVWCTRRSATGRTGSGSGTPRLAARRTQLIFRSGRSRYASSTTVVAGAN